MTEPSCAPVREDGSLRIISGPFSLTTLAFWGAVVFAVGFWHGRQLSQLENGARADAAVPQLAEPSVTQPAVAAPAATQQPAAAARATVTIRVMKFSPETIEIKAGDEVEWANKDLTPHTATSQPGGPHELDSGSIEAGGSWQHRFTTPGTFPYFCTFHPEMKGVVIVK